MTTIEVKIARNDTHVATIAKKTEDESLAQFVENLQQAKQETNELLTTLVEADKLKQSEQPTEATKRKTSEPVQGNYLLRICCALTRNKFDLFQVEKLQNGMPAPKMKTTMGVTTEVRTNDISKIHVLSHLK